MKRAVITGATGQIGMALTNYLTSQGMSLTLVVRPNSRRIGNIVQSDMVRVVECDMASIASLEKVIDQGQDVFFNLYWDVSMPRNNPVTNANCILHVLEAVKLAKALGCSTFVGAGSQAEYGHVEGVISADTHENPQECYGIAKLAAGRLSRVLCTDLGLRHCWCRIFSSFGPGDRETTAIMYCIHSLLRGEKPSLTPGGQIWDFIYSADCARALHAVALNGRHGAVYPIGSGQSKPLHEFFEIIRDCINPSLPLGLGEREYAPGQVMHLAADISALSADTGFSPAYSFEDGIRETIAWVRARAQ